MVPKERGICDVNYQYNRVIINKIYPQQLA